MSASTSWASRPAAAEVFALANMSIPVKVVYEAALIQLPQVVKVPHRQGVKALKLQITPQGHLEYRRDGLGSRVGLPLQDLGGKNSMLPAKSSFLALGAIS